MNCNKIEENIIDYIEGTLNKEEKLEIQRHISECEGCKKEYEELKATIHYIKDESKDIGENKQLKLNANIRRGQTFKRFTRTGIIAITISLLLIVTAIATEMFGYMDWLRETSEEKIIAWDELIEDGLGQKLDISIEDQEIRLTAKGVVADDVNTMILIEVEDLKEKIRFTPLDVSIYGDIEREGNEWIEGGFDPIVNRENIYNEGDGKLSFILKTEPMNKDEGILNINIDVFQSMFNTDLESIVKIKGDWNLTIPAKKLETRVYNINEKIDIGGNELIIENILIAPTTTNIKYKYDIYNDEKKYSLRDVTFAIELDGKTYRRPIINAGLGSLEEIKNAGFQKGDAYLQSLYLEDPEEFDIIVETYRYTTSGVERFDIDWRKLPQTIIYQASKIKVKEVDYSEDGTRIVFEEDTRWRRKYIRSNIYMEKPFQKQFEDDGKTIKLNSNREFYANPTKLKTKDENGIVKEDIKVWTDKMYNFVLEQELVLSGKTFEQYPHKIIYDKEELLKPGKIIIEGQEFIEYPNMKRRIKLR